MRSFNDEPSKSSVSLQLLTEPDLIRVRALVPTGEARRPSEGQQFSFGSSEPAAGRHGRLTLPSASTHQTSICAAASEPSVSECRSR